MHVAALFRDGAMGHDLLYGVALILSPLLVCLCGDELPKAGVAKTSAGHHTLLEKGHNSFSMVPSGKGSPSSFTKS